MACKVQIYMSTKGAFPDLYTAMAHVVIAYRFEIYILPKGTVLDSAQMCVDMCVDIYMDMCTGICMVMFVDDRVYMRVCMCADMHINIW